MTTIEKITQSGKKETTSKIYTWNK